MDDYDDTREMVASLLGAVYRVSQATNGIEALEIARRDQPSVIVMDIAMPVLDGLAATKVLRADPTLRGIPVIACTAQPSLVAGERRLFFAVIAKPVDYPSLLREIKAAVRSGSR